MYDGSSCVSSFLAQGHCSIHFWSSMFLFLPIWSYLPWLPFSLVLWQISEAINSSNLTSRYIFTGTLRVLKNLSIPQPVINSSTPYLSFEYILVGYLCLRVLGEGCRWVAGTKMNPSFTDKEQLPKPPWPRKLSIPIPQFSYFRIIALSFQVINIFVNMTHTYWFWPQRGC